MEKSQKKREDYVARAAKFSKLKKRRLNEKKKTAESNAKIINEDEDILTELDNVIKENKIALTGLEDYKKIIQMKEKEERMKLKLEEQLRICIEENVKKENNVMPNIDTKDDELRKTEERIKEFDLSLAALDYELENFEIDSENEWLFGIGCLGADL